MHEPTLKKRIAISLITVLICLGMVQTAVAHGEGQTIELTAVPVGPYFLTVYSSPGILRVGEIHFSSIVVDDTNRPVTDCDLLVAVVPSDESAAPVTLQARPATPTTSFMHDVELDVTENGRYQIIVTVIDPQGGGGDASFDIQVVHTPLWLKIPLIFSAFLTFFFALLLLKQALQAVGLWQPTFNPDRGGGTSVARPRPSDMRERRSAR